MKNRRTALFRFMPFSRKQKKILTWWTDASPVKDMDGIIADGAIRSGKTMSMSLSFVLWAMSTFDGQIFTMSGKTIASFRRNVLITLKLMLRSMGYSVKERRSDNLVIIRKNGVENQFFMFGGQDESSQDLIQGITSAGAFFDEVALMPESFVNQAVARCSVPGSKHWFNCNPEGPVHYFKVGWIDKRAEKRYVYLHFEFDDNPSLTKEIKDRYHRMFSGVFYDRFILGLWKRAEGAIYRTFADAPEKFVGKPGPGDKIVYANIGVDFGGNKSQSAFVLTGFTANFRKVFVLLTECRPAGSENPDTLATAFVDFCRRALAITPNVNRAYCDSAEQILIRGLRNAVLRAGLPIRIMNALKSAINERIRLVCGLIGMGRYFIGPECKDLSTALQSATWDEKKQQDERLDDGSYNVDVLDAMEYSIEPMSRNLGMVTKDEPARIPEKVGL